ncbi:MAG TPA: hypothetical protein DCZ93_04580 [Elusimicrobia bacterium]|nr:hypothetical protein [Elusimicrobiota bacterium]
MLNLCFFVLMAVSPFVFILSAVAEELKWEDVAYSQELERNKFVWAESNEVQKAAYLELYNKSIQYSLKNIGKPIKELDLSEAGPRIAIYHKVTFETISMLYREYGDLRKAAEYMFQFWGASQGGLAPDMLNADANPTDYVISNYEDAGMYKELSVFYSDAYKEKMKWLALGTDIKLLKIDFKKYKQNWPEKAEEYQSFMHNWRRAKQLAKTKKPKPLEPAVQNHEWFYSDRQEEVLKALEYYQKNKVQFMLEKALAHKDPIVAEKAKEYLENLKKGETNETENKKP